MHIPEEPETPLSINIVPMIDVIFAILAFLIISTLFLTRSQGLPVNLPQATTAQTQDGEQINVTMRADGTIALNRQPISLDKIEFRVQQLVETGGETLVLINADSQVSHGKVVQIMDLLRQVEGVRLAIAVEPQTTK